MVPDIIFFLITLLLVVISDLILYPMWGAKYPGILISPYRIFQGGLKIVATILLYEIGGWKSALCFNICWLTWIDDILYYLIYDSIGLLIGRPSALKAEVLANKVNWDKWTIFGCWKLFGSNKATCWQLLLFQAILGISLILLTFYTL